MKTVENTKKYNVGDVVWATGRYPMPETMEKSLFRKQVIKEAYHPLYVFESGWSVNLFMGDKMFRTK